VRSRIAAEFRSQHQPLSFVQINRPLHEPHCSESGRKLQGLIRASLRIQLSWSKSNARALRLGALKNNLITLSGRVRGSLGKRSHKIFHGMGLASGILLDGLNDCAAYGRRISKFADLRELRST
jgi:hypothetical protein